MPSHCERDRPLSPLDISLECFKRASNARLDFIERLYDARPLWKQYLSGSCDIHVHTVSKLCLNYSAVSESSLVCRENNATFNGREFPVFVLVGDSGKSFSPVASTVRLKPLDLCYMAGIDASEKSVNPSLEFVAREFIGNWIPL